MEFKNIVNDDVILAEIGKRLARRRIELQITQASLAEQAGVAKRTVERAEAGGSIQFTNMIRILRILGLLDGLDRLIPESMPSPIDLLKLKGKERRRASSKTSKSAMKSKWSWGNE